MSKEIFNKIVSKLEKLEKYLKYLKDIQKINKKSFLKDYHNYGLAERYLQLSIQIILDIGKLIIIEKNLPKPEDNEETFEELFKNKIINAKLKKRLHGISGFRNILVHEYENINKELVYEKLQNNLQDLHEFHVQIKKFLKKQI